MVKKNEMVKDYSGSKKKKYTEIASGSSGSKKKKKYTEIAASGSGSKKNKDGIYPQSFKRTLRLKSKPWTEYTGGKDLEAPPAELQWSDVEEDEFGNFKSKKKKKNKKKINHANRKNKAKPDADKKTPPPRGDG